MSKLQVNENSVNISENELFWSIYYYSTTVLTVLLTVLVDPALHVTN